MFSTSATARMLRASENDRTNRRFFKDEIGSMSIFSVFMFMTILILGGLGIDMMATELRRMKLQATLDRAVLAAASHSQDLDAETVVRDYFAKSGMLEYLDDVDPHKSITTKTVFAEASAPRESIFLKLLGVEEMEAKAKGTATESINKVEVSLVLDISGSMKDDSKLTNMQDAAVEFVHALVNDDTKDRVSLSLVPYSEHVAIGPDLMNQLNVDLQHVYSFCVEMPDAEFGSAKLDRTLVYEQAQHFQWNHDGATNDRSAPVCPQQSYEWVRPLSQDADLLEDQIRAFQPRSGTSIFLGMKWGAAMLDPSFRGITSNLISAGRIDGTFANRPVDYPADDEEPETYKTIVLMTDGKNDKSNRIRPANYATYDQRALWAKYSLLYWGNYKSGSTTIKDKWQWDGSTEEMELDIGDLLGSTTASVEGTVSATFAAVEGLLDLVGLGGLLGLGGDDDSKGKGNNGQAKGNGICYNWANADNNGNGTDGNEGNGNGNACTYEATDFDLGDPDNAVTFGYSLSGDYYERKYTASQGDTLLKNICDAAKGEGIVIWTIAFETDDHGAGEMEKCASSPNHYFDVEGKDIGKAFGQIAQQISSLKLIN